MFIKYTARPAHTHHDQMTWRIRVHAVELPFGFVVRGSRAGR
jgi:hypothetical protein